jgi:hypothetical protein
MNDINFDDFKVRCSAISMAEAESKSNPSITEIQLKRMQELESKENITEKQKDELAGLQLKQENSKIVVLSDTYIGYLMEEYAWRTDQMLAVNKELDTHQINKGKDVEKDSVFLLRAVDGIFYNYNEQKERVENEYLSGEVDCWLGDTIMGAEIIGDLKNVWDYIVFLKKINQPLSVANEKQVRGYMNITGAQQGFIADCLMDTPEYIKFQIKQKLFRKGMYLSEESADFLFDWAMYERSMTFSDKLSLQKRVNKKIVEPMNDFQTNFLYDQVKRGRDFLNEFHEKRKNLQ